VVGVVILHRALLVGTFDVAQARLMGFRPQLTHFVLLVLLALSIVASFETVGSLLVFAFLIAPPATASLFINRVRGIMLGAVAIGAIGAVFGLLISYHHATATGATMALTTVVIFLLALAATNVTSLASATNR
jgi:ABC-type Mn2+/Zn2+ transport system permease subunit